MTWVFANKANVKSQETGRVMWEICQSRYRELEECNIEKILGTWSHYGKLVKWLLVGHFFIYFSHRKGHFAQRSEVRFSCSYFCSRRFFAHDHFSKADGGLTGGSKARLTSKETIVK